MPKARSNHRAASSILTRLRRPGPWVLAGAFAGALAAGGGWGTWKNLCAGDACPSIAQIKTYEPQQTSKIMSWDGRLLTEIGFERRTPISIHALPEYVPQAVIAIEDRRFYDHGGFDLRGIARAAVGVLTGQNRGGGSTITQQLARNMFDEIGFERRITRKLKEVQVALDLEQSYTKDQILEGYINEIYMGRGWGFQNAARSYFGKSVTDIDVAEAALLAAILNRPASYDPFRHPVAAKQRRDLVLSRMAAEGFLTRDEARAWMETPLPQREPEGLVSSVAPYFEEWVRQILDSRFGSKVYRGGLRVFTTLDVDIQRAAVVAMDSGFAAIESDPIFPHPRMAEFDTVDAFPGAETPYIQGALVALDPATGAVRAMVGGRDFRQSKFDRARLARRQTGSAFKPFVYAAAVAAGIPASHVIEDGPIAYPQVDGTVWEPRNFDPEFKGPITLRQALYQSVNTVAIKLGWEEVGIESVAQTARRLGIQTEIERFPSTTIGAVAAIPLQMAEAYAAFPAMGMKARPFPILRVEDAEGRVLWEPQPERTQVLDSLVARVMVSMLEDVVVRGTGYTGIRLTAGLPREVPAGGKTGTTNDGTDVWFVGFTPDLVASIWFGMDRPAPIFRLGRGRQATGGGLASPVFGRFMRQVYYGAPAGEDGRGGVDPALPLPGPWPAPAGLRTAMVDRHTGLLASRWCPAEDQYQEVFIAGTEPTEYCGAEGEGRRRLPWRQP